MFQLTVWKVPAAQHADREIDLIAWRDQIALVTGGAGALAVQRRDFWHNAAQPYV